MGKQGKHVDGARNLLGFRGKVPFCRQSALAGILDLVEKEGVPPQHKRKNIRQAIQTLIASMNLYGPLLVTVTAMSVVNEPRELLFANIFPTLLQLTNVEEHLQTCLTIFTCKFLALWSVHGAPFATQMKFTQAIN